MLRSRAGVTYDQTHWVPVQRRGPLPTFYYHEHFTEMLDFVAEHYAHTFLAEHAAFVGDFRALPRDAQRLYVRLVNRKGRLFARNRLRYPELGQLSPLVDDLATRGWVKTPGAEHFDEMLHFLKRDEIVRVLLPRFTGLARSMKKAQLVEFARENLPGSEFIEALDTDRILVQGRADEVGYLLFLYFGYMALQSSIEDQRMADKASGLLAIVGVVNIPIIHYSVEWWNSLHQTASLTKFEKPSMPPSMYVPILLMALSFKIYFILTLFQRVRAELLSRERNSRWVEELTRS